jgi:hypothetical protein
MAPYIPPAQMRVLYYDLMEELNELQFDYNLLNHTIQELLGNTADLQWQIDSLNSTCNNLQDSIDNLQGQVDSLNSTLKSGQEAIINELSTIRNLMYLFIATTVILIATTVYFAKRKPKQEKNQKYSHNPFLSIFAYPQIFSSRDEKFLAKSLNPKERLSKHREVETSVTTTDHNDLEQSAVSLILYKHAK